MRIKGKVIEVGIFYTLLTKEAYFVVKLELVYKFQCNVRLVFYYKYFNKTKINKNIEWDGQWAFTYLHLARANLVYTMVF